MQHSDEAAVPFALQENGSVSINHAAEEEMDLAAERLAREMMYPPQ
ncbi:hypothetical protein [Granulicella sp. S156]|jgi:hypothetical protein|nr:hypothetical protein [Granulicella sp. S156]